jgi:hypothetical protein
MGEVRHFVRTLSIEYRTELIPLDGPLVCREAAAPLKAGRKDPAGHAFHAFARKQSGFFGAFSCSRLWGKCRRQSYHWPNILRGVRELLRGSSGKYCLEGVYIHKYYM